MSLKLAKRPKWEDRVEPCMEFESEEQAYQCLDYWQNKLFLNDWIFKLHLAEPDSSELEKDGDQMSGTIHMTFQEKCAVINIARLTEDLKGRITKVCHECILVHEMLHTMYNWIIPPSTHEGMYLDEKEHQLLEQMAKSLVMVRYNLDYGWFINFTREEWKNDIENTTP